MIRVAGFERSATEGWRGQVSKTYDAYNRLATKSDARGNVKTHTYEHARGLHLGTTYTVVAYFFGEAKISNGSAVGVLAVG